MVFLFCFLVFLQQRWVTLFFHNVFSLVDTDVELGLTAVFAVLAEPCAVLAHRLDLLAIVVRDGVAGRVGRWVRTVPDNVLVELLVHLTIVVAEENM